MRCMLRVSARDTPHVHWAYLYNRPLNRPLFWMLVVVVEIGERVPSTCSAFF